MLIFRPFKVGDFIEGAGVNGVVEALHIFTTTLKTGDNKTVIIPNGDLASGTIVNYSTQPTRRVDLVFGIAYGDSIGQAIEVLSETVRAHDLVLADPPPVYRVGELGDSSVNLLCRPWVKTADYWTVYWDLTRQVKEAFDAAGVNIPFPQRDVHLYQQPGS